MNNDLLEAARSCLQRGWSFIPVSASGKYAKQPHFVLTQTGHYSLTLENKKRPSWKAFQAYKPTLEEAEVWFRQTRDKGIAVVTGEVSRLVVLDFDGPEGLKVIQQLGLMPHVRTGSGGYHLYVQHPGWRVSTVASKSKKSLSEKFMGMDIRGDGGLAMLPPSRNQNGWYTWLRDPQDLLKVEDLPRELREYTGLLEAPLPVCRDVRGLDEAHRFQAPQVVDLIQRALERIQRGTGRNDAGFYLACRLRDCGYSFQEGQQAMQMFVDHVPDTNLKGQREPYQYSEAISSLHSAFNRPPRTPYMAGR